MANTDTPTPPETKSPEPVTTGTESGAESGKATPALSTSTPTTPAPDADAGGATTPEGAPEAHPDFQSLAEQNRARLEAGEKVAYKRDFLLKFQHACLDKPKELPNLDVILDAPTDGHRKPPVHERTKTVDIFTPNFFKKPSRKGPSDRRNSNKQAVIKLKQPTEVKLHSTGK